MLSFSVDVPRGMRRGASPAAAASSEGRIALFLQRFLKGKRGPDLSQMARRIILPSLPVADEDMACLSLREAGRHMARQEQWDELAERIDHADDARLITPGGASEARLLINGAQSDVSGAATHALEDGQVPDLSGLAALERIAVEHRESHAMAMVVAEAHVQIGRAWLGATEISPSQHRKHFKRAQALLSRFDAAELEAPSLAAMDATLAELLAPVPGAVVSAYQRLLALDPESPTHLRAFGLACLDAQTDELPLLSHHAASLSPATLAAWGQGGYTWLYLDALKQCDAVLSSLDVERFMDGMRDILRLRPNQHLTNELAAFCALSMAPDRPRKPRSAEKARAKLHGCLSWILSDHLQELHPTLWADRDARMRSAQRLSAPRAHASKGREVALQVIARQFADQLADGSSIAFSPAGMYRLPAI